MTGQLNGFSLLALAAYLALVVYKGNVDELLKLLLEEKDFLPWLLSILIVYWLWRSDPAGKLIGGIAGLALLAAAFQVLPKLFP